MTEMTDYTLTDMALVQHLLEMDGKGDLNEKESKFANNCRINLQKYPTLTWKMQKWARSIVKRDALKDQQVAADDLPDLSGIHNIFANVPAKLKFPKITFSTETLGTVQLKRAGKKSQYTGQLIITDGRRFGQNEYYGRITLEGEFVVGRDCLQKHLDFLRGFSNDPVAWSLRYAKDTGNCCFCNHALGEGEDKRSLKVGYGPVCAKNFGLPWGSKKKRKAA